MSINSWWKQKFGKVPSPLAFYKSGIAKARKRDLGGAIADYTAAIDTPSSTPELKAMALFNRAVVHAAARENAKAIEDLNSVLKMNEPLMDVKKAAKQKLEKINRRSGKEENSN